MGLNQLEKSFYVGASLTDKEVAAAVAEAIIQKFGYRPTYRWFDIGSVTREQYPATSLMEMNGVVTADIFVGILPGRFGMAAELGGAIADKQHNRYKKVILWGKDRQAFVERPDGSYPCVFVGHPDVERIVGEDPVKTVVDYLFNRSDRVLAFP